MWQHMFSMHVTRTVWSRELMAPHSTRYMHTKHMLPHNHDGLTILFKYLNSFKYQQLRQRNK